MSAEYATFGLAPAMRAGGVLTNGDYQVHREFLDFIVNGSPLLFQLSDLDAVSPLASDIPPAIFTAHVRRLLLEADAPLPGGRYVIYGCPECEGLECGAVTAVIEADGPDVIWRDFAWQTEEQADLELNG
ncbi:oxidoreductase, partial [Streptomyces sp. NPDC056728]